MEEKTRTWLQAKTWSSREVTRGQYLIDGWLKSENMPQSTRILQRWIQERAAKNPVVTGQSIVDLLHRVLHGLKLHGDDRAAETGLQLLQEVEEACRGDPESHLPGNKAYSMVFQLLALQAAKDPSTLDTGQELLERRLQNGTPDLQLWQSCLNVMAKCSDPQAADRVESTLQRMNVPPDVVCFACVIHAWSGRSAERAQAILVQMLSPESPVEPNSVCVNSCIDAWAKSGQVQRAQELLRWMEALSRQPGKEHLQPDSVAYSTVVHAWAKSGDPQAGQQAEHLFEQMQRLYEEGHAVIRPDEYTCGSVLDAWSRSNYPGAAQRAQDFLKRLEEMHAQRKLMSCPSSTMYTIVINAWANSPDLNAAERAEDILKQMEGLSRSGRKEVAPGTIAYTNAIHAWSKSSDVNAPFRALTLLRRMQELQESSKPNVSPNTVTFNAVMDVCARHGEAELVAGLLEEMHTRMNLGEGNVEPDTISYATVINAYAKVGSPERAALVLHEMESLFHDGNETVRPNAVAYTAAIAAWAAYCDSYAGDKAEAILWRMMDQFNAGNDDAKPNAITVAAVMRVWSAGHEAEAPERVEALLKWMKAQYETGNESIKPTVIHYNHLLESWAKSRRFDSVRRIKFILQSMLQDPSNALHPDCRSYNMLMLAIRNSADRDKATRCLEVLQEMIKAYKNGNIAVKPTRWSFHIVLTACLETTNDREADERLTDVFRETFHTFIAKSKWEPSSSTYHLLMNVCKTLRDSIDAALFDEVRRYCEASGKVEWAVPSPLERKQYFWQTRRERR
jgi:pentatricopeptide repeat protein